MDTRKGRKLGFPVITDLTSDIVAYENGELDIDEVRELFQHLVDTGLAWQLQGSYGRMALALLEAGEIHG